MAGALNKIVAVTDDYWQGYATLVHVRSAFIKRCDKHNY